jgi:hypothetical protein
LASLAIRSASTSRLASLSALSNFSLSTRRRVKGTSLRLSRTKKRGFQKSSEKIGAVADPSDLVGDIGRRAEWKRSTRG